MSNRGIQSIPATVKETIVITTAAIKLRNKPLRAISSVRMPPAPKTMTLGAVATGSMNAQEQLIVPGNINNSGGSPTSKDNAAKIGSNNIAVAVLLVISVRNVTSMQMDRTIAHGGASFRNASCRPIETLNPD